MGQGAQCDGEGVGPRQERKGLEMRRALRGRSSKKGLQKDMLQEFKER